MTRSGGPNWGCAVSSTVARRGLLDTPVLLAIQTGDAGALQFAYDMYKTVGLEFSELSAMVLLASSNDSAEQVARLGFIRSNPVHRLTAVIARRAFALVVSLPVPPTLTADDAIVAATAIEHSLPLYTLDPARFAPVPGLATIQPF